jgi:AraC-like DNA-binding protein
VARFIFAPPPLGWAPFTGFSLAYLAVFQPDPRAEARLCDALEASHRVVLARSWAGLERLLAGEETLDGVIVDADSPGREEAVAEIRRIRLAYPSLAIVAHADVGEGDPELFRFGRYGVDGIVLAHPPVPSVLVRQAVARALASARAEHVRAALRGRYSAFASDAVAWTVEHAVGSPDVTAFAAALGRSRRTLATALRAEGLPAASRVLLWGRILTAGACLARDGKTVEDVAFLLGYSSANALARAMKRETGHTPKEIAERGGLDFVRSVLFPRRRSPRRRGGGAAKAVAALLLASAQASCVGPAAWRPSSTPLLSTTPSEGAASRSTRDRGWRRIQAPGWAPAEPPAKGSTLEDRLPGFEGRLLAGMGIMSSVNSLSGHLVGDDGREVVFSILSNGSGLASPWVRDAIDDVVKVPAGRHP